MVEKILYLAGLPRSGSTLLVNILNQNDRIRASSTSPMCDILAEFRNGWQINSFSRALGDDRIDEYGLSVMRGSMHGWIKAHSVGGLIRPVFVDKSRGWTAFPEMAAALAGVDIEKLKVICCVRDLREVVGSMERRHRESNDTRNTMLHRLPNGNVQHVVRMEDRLAGMMNPDNGIIGGPILCMREMEARGLSSQMYMVSYEKLRTNPEKELRKLHEFIDEKDFKYDFEHIEQKEKEDDLVFNFKRLHDIRSAVKKDGHTEWQKQFDGDILKTQIWTQIDSQKEFWSSWKTADK